MGLWRPLLVASANSRSGRLDGCGQLPTHSAQPPVLGACRLGGTPRGGDTGVPPHNLAGCRRRQRLSPGSARGAFSCSSGGWFLAAAPLLRPPRRAPGPEVQGPPSGIPAPPMLLRFVRARRTVMVNIYCRGKQPHGPARGPARRCQGAGRPGCCPEAATLTGPLGDRRPGPGLGLPVGHTPAPRSAWDGGTRAPAGPGLLARGQGTRGWGAAPTSPALRWGGHVGPHTGLDAVARACRAHSTGGQGLRMRGDAPLVPSMG